MCLTSCFASFGDESFQVWLQKKKTLEMKARDYSHFNYDQGMHLGRYKKDRYKGRGAIRADFGPMSEINFVVVTI